MRSAISFWEADQGRGDHSSASTYKGFGFLVDRTGREFEFSRASGETELCLFCIGAGGADSSGDAERRGSSFDGRVGKIVSVVDELSD